jgi:hypothetical protein
MVLKRPGECGSVFARSRATSGVRLSHHICAQPMKNRYSGE